VAQGIAPAPAIPETKGLFEIDSRLCDIWNIGVERKGAMTGLWIYHRRGCCGARYRHGGYNAIIPMETHTVARQVALMRQLAERRLAEAGSGTERPASEPRNNVLNLAERRNRSGRQPGTRGGGKRPGGPNGN